MKVQIDECLEHLEDGGTLAALGAFEGLEPRVISIGCTLRLMARLYPKSSESPNTNINEQE